MTEISRTIGGPEEARSLLTKDLPQLQINEVLPIQTGRENFVVEVNGSWIFRFPRASAPAHSSNRPSDRASTVAPHSPGSALLNLIKSPRTVAQK